VRVKTFEQIMSVTGNTPATATLMDNEAYALYNACLSVPKDGLVMEVGCQLGRSSSIISQLSYDIGYDAIHIDPYTRQPDWMKQWMEMMYKLGPLDNQAFSLLCMRTEQAARILSRLGPLDMAYIDGDHETAAVLIDMRLVADRIKPAGMLAVHDYNPARKPNCNDFYAVVAAMEIYLASGLWDKVEQSGEMGVWRRK
jgi:Methyltransferase domain